MLERRPSVPTILRVLAKLVHHGADSCYGLTFLDHLARIFVLSQALEADVSQLLVAGPLKGAELEHAIQVLPRKTAYPRASTTQTISRQI